MTYPNSNGAPLAPRTIRETFRWCLLHGFNALPGQPRSKETVFSGDGVYKAVARPDHLDSWFPEGVERNLGVVNGELSGNLADVDLDCEVAVRLAPTFLPKTNWRFRRDGAKDSAHWLYRTDAPFPHATRKFVGAGGAKKDTLVELRGSGHWSVWPPSVHPTGKRLVWDSVDDQGPPRVLLAELERSVARLAAATLLARCWPAEGSRHDASNALAGGLLRGGWAAGDVERFVEAVASAAGDEEARDRVRNVSSTARKIEAGGHATGWPALEGFLGQHGTYVVRQVREWLGMASSAKPSSASPKLGRRYRPLPPYQPFPVHVLPPVLRDLVEGAARAIGCDPALVALPALATAAGAIGNSRAIMLKKKWIEPVAIWAGTVADSGTAKSPAYAAAVDPLMSLQMDLYDAHRDAMCLYNNEVAEWKEADKEERGGKPEPPEPPPTFVVGDTTIEALGEVLRDSPRGLLVGRDELDGWLTSFTRYKGAKGGTDRPAWLELHRAGTLLIERLTRDKGQLAVRRALVSVTGTIQPGTLARALDADAVQAGLGARLLLAMPPKRKRVWVEDDSVEDETAERYQELLRGLLALELADCTKRRPHVLTLSEPARRMWIQFFNEWGEIQHGAEGEQAAAFAKIEGYAARLMLLHHVVAHVACGEDDRSAITEASAAAGIEMARWFAYEATRIYMMLREDDEERDTRRLVEWVRSRCGRVTARQLCRSNSGRWRTPEDARVRLDGLVALGLGSWVEDDWGGGGRRSRWFVLANPTPDVSDVSPDDEDDGGVPPSDDSPDGSPEAPGGWPERTATSSSRGDPCGGESPDRETETSETSGVGRGSGTEKGEKDEGANPGVLSSKRRAAGEQAAGPELSVVDGCDPDGNSVGVPLPTPDVSDDSSARFQLVGQAAGLSAVLAAIEESGFVALDLETTGLNPRTDRVRLLSLCVEAAGGTGFTYLVDCSLVDPGPVVESLTDKEIVVHNASFDLGFLYRMGFQPKGAVHCTLTMSRVLYAGERFAGESRPHSLEACAKRELGLTLDKGHQASDWSGTLTRGQLGYAARDVEVLRPLHEALTRKLREANLDQVAAVEARCVPALAWVSASGVAVDRQAWVSLADAAEADVSRLRQEMAALAPVRPGEMFASWNFDSAQDTLAMFQALGFPAADTTDGTLARIDHPLAAKLRDYRSATKRTGTYGRDWLKHVAEDGRVYPRWNQTGSDAGRMSCADPNMQQLPRDKAYRRCVAAPPGRVLVKADYSQIELRIAAKVSGDKALLDAYVNGIDVHTQTAQRVLGKEDVTRQDRQLAKALNFGLLYGMGVERFILSARSEYGIEMTQELARTYRDAFFRAYPGLKRWHRRTGQTRDQEVATRTALGRRRLKVKRFTEKLNTPVQGTGADGLKAALALLWERRAEQPGAFPVLVVHDEIVVECDAGRRGPVSDWLRRAMLDGMAPLIDPVPVAVEVKVARTWGGD